LTQKLHVQNGSEKHNGHCQKPTEKVHRNARIYKQDLIFKRKSCTVPFVEKNKK